MATCKTLPASKGRVGYKVETPVCVFGAFHMAKKYELVRDKIQLPGGGFMEAFRMALVEFSCLGERHLDLAGYSHDSEAEALRSDWEALGGDFREAAKKLAESVEDDGGSCGVGGSARRGQVAAAE
jgi:hypothetical protein